MKYWILSAAVISSPLYSQAGEYVPQPYRYCESDSYVTFEMDECLANRLKSSTVTEVCRGIAKSFDREYLVVQITSVIDGAVRPECLFAYNRRPHRIERTRECDQLESRYYISNYGKLPRTEISECRTENKELSSLSGASTDGSQFEVEP